QSEGLPPAVLRPQPLAMLPYLSDTRRWVVTASRRSGRSRGAGIAGHRHCHGDVSVGIVTVSVTVSPGSVTVSPGSVTVSPGSWTVFVWWTVVVGPGTKTSSPASVR